MPRWSATSRSQWFGSARHATHADVITLDFANTALDPGARAGVELTLESASALPTALDRVVAAVEYEEAEVREIVSLDSRRQSVRRA